MLANLWTFQEVTGWVEIVRLFKCGGSLALQKTDYRCKIRILSLNSHLVSIYVDIPLILLTKLIWSLFKTVDRIFKSLKKSGSGHCDRNLKGFSMDINGRSPETLSLCNPIRTDVRWWCRWHWELLPCQGWNPNIVVVMSSVFRQTIRYRRTTVAQPEKFMEMEKVHASW